MSLADTRAEGRGATSCRSGSLLLVDDEPDNLALLEGMLSRTRYATTRAANGRIALDMLLADPGGFDAVLLDRMMPVMDGLAVLAAMRQHEELRHLPVILQTAAGNSAQIAEGLAAGAHYYLVKPFDRAQLVPIVNGAVGQCQLMREMRHKLMDANPLGLIVRGQFRFRTREEARELAVWLARASGEPSPVVYGLQALMLNAIEHGNLGLGYEGKRQAMNQGRLEATLDELEQRPENAARYATVDIQRDDNEVVYTIHDQGGGFDHRRYETRDPARALDPNGRGIVIARELSFDEVSYLDGGRTVRASTELNGWQEI